MYRSLNKAFKSIGCLIRKLFIKTRISFYWIIGKKRIHIKQKHGNVISFRTNDVFCYKQLVLGSIELETEEKILANVSKGMTVLDIGANIGYFTVLMARIVGEEGKVIAVEPNPLMVKEIENNIRLNHLNNVIIERVALSNRAGEAGLYFPEKGYECYGGLRPNKSFPVSSKMMVRTETIDDILNRHCCRKVDVVKIDVEGAEFLIFEGGRMLLEHMGPHLLFECNENLCESFGHSIFDVLEYLKKKGYSVKQYDYGMWEGRRV